MFFKMITATNYGITKHHLVLGYLQQQLYIIGSNQ